MCKQYPCPEPYCLRWQVSQQCRGRRGSPDRSGEICDEYAKKDSRVRVFHKNNGGASAARRDGVEMSRGKWITFVDSDDWIDAEMYMEMYDAAIRNNVDMVCCDLLVEEKNNKTILSYKNNYIQRFLNWGKFEKNSNTIFYIFFYKLKADFLK